MTHIEGGMLEIITQIYQAKNGGIFLSWGNAAIKLSKDEAEVVADSIPEIDRDQYVRFYTV